MSLYTDNLFSVVANTMYRSLQQGKPVGMDVKTVAAGLAPPYAGTNANSRWKIKNICVSVLNICKITACT